MCMRRVLFLLVFLAIAMSPSLLGQANTASIRGIVTDPSGAVIPGAQVTLINTGTGVQTATKANPAGEYLFEFLPPGTYKIEVHSAGFKTFARENVTLDLARQLRIDVPLEPGQITETVNVSGEAPLVETENGGLGTTVQNQMVTELPLLSRNPQSLVLLGAGVAQTVDGNVTNGGLIRIDPYYIDGADSSNHVWSGTPVNPNPDVINEFRAMTNAYSAEYGETSGVTMIATTKSGTNSFHGSAFEFLQNDDLNAGNYFTHSVPVLRFNQFGGTLRRTHQEEQAVLLRRHAVDAAEEPAADHEHYRADGSLPGRGFFEPARGQRRHRRPRSDRSKIRDFQPVHATPDYCLRRKYGVGARSIPGQ